MNISEAKKIVDRFVATRLQNDPVTLRPLFTADARFAIAGATSERSIAMCCETPDAFENAVHLMLATWHWHEVDVKSVLVEGDTIACRYALKVTFVPTATTFTTEIVDFFEIRDGKIKDLTQFVDTARASEIALASA